jgi:hypothetical protein
MPITRIPKKSSINFLLLNKFRNTKSGSVVIAGSAPSLGTDLKLVNQLSTNSVLTLNSAVHFFKSDRWDVSSVIADPLAYSDLQSYLGDLRIQTFISANVGVKDLRQWEACYRVYQRPFMYDGYFTGDASSGIYDGHTVLVHAIQLAVFLGYKKIIFTGIELDFNLFRLHSYKSSFREIFTSLHRRRKTVPLMRKSFLVALTKLNELGVEVATTSKKLSQAFSIPLLG